MDPCRKFSNTIRQYKEISIYIPGIIQDKKITQEVTYDGFVKFSEFISKKPGPEDQALVYP